MSNVNGVGSSAAVYAGSGFSPSGLSPDALLAYCEMQLDNYGGQISDLMKEQQQQLADQGIVNNLKSQLEQLGAPSDAAHMQTAVQDFQDAINQLPDGDPVKAQLQQECQSMCSQYGYSAGPPLTANQEKFVQAAFAYADNPNDSSALQTLQAMGYDPGLTDTLDTARALQQSAQGTLSAAPTSDQWQGTVDDVANIGGNINSQAQIQMLQLQQLASYQQQAVEQAINLMSKEDSTLLDEAKNA